MDTTQTAKQEALYILRVIERGSADRAFIGNARLQFYALMKDAGCDQRDYLDSVDACLTLFPVDEYVVFIQRNPNFSGVKVRRVRDVLDGNRDPLADVEAKTLPLAMLKAWWSIQT